MGLGVCHSYQNNREIVLQSSQVYHTLHGMFLVLHDGCIRLHGMRRILVLSYLNKKTLCGYFYLSLLVVKAEIDKI